MPSYLKEICDAVIGSLEIQSPDFQNNIRQVFCKMDEAYRVTNDKDTKRAEKLSNECRSILVILHLFPLELQLAMDNLYKKTLWGFLSIYLDFKMILIDKNPDKQAYFDKVMDEIFALLGEDKTHIWSVVVTSHTLNRIEILRLLACRCIEETRKSAYDNEQYIRMIWVLHVFFSQCKKSGIKDEVAKVLEIALRLKHPSGLCKWMCHHFPGYGWKGLSDEHVHETLVSEKQPKSFFYQVFNAISKDDTLKYHLDYPSSNGNRDEDSSSQSSGSANAKKRSSSDQANESEKSSKRAREDTEKTSVDKESEDPSNSKLINDKSNKSSEKEDSFGGDSTVNDSKVKKTTESPKKSDASSETTKVSKTLGPGKPKLTSLTSFLDDDDDTNATVRNNDGDSDKEVKDKSDIHSDEENMNIRKDEKTTKRARKEADETSEDESVTASGRAKRSSRGKAKEVKSKASKVVSGSETDVDSVVEEPMKMLRTRRPLKRKSNDYSESETEEEDDDDDDDDDDDGDDIARSSARNSRSKQAKEKAPAKKSKVNKSFTSGTTIERVEEDESEIIEKYMNGPFRHIFEEFESEKMVEGAQAYIYLENICIIPPEEKESNLADLLHNARTREKKSSNKKRRSKRY